MNSLPPDDVVLGMSLPVRHGGQPCIRCSGWNWTGMRNFAQTGGWSRCSAPESERWRAELPPEYPG
jgi:hypothetical protein